MHLQNIILEALFTMWYDLVSFFSTPPIIGKSFKNGTSTYTHILVSRSNVVDGCLRHLYAVRDCGNGHGRVPPDSQLSSRAGR